MGVGPISSSGSGRRPVDAELNLVPFIDLLVCCICFLLITAVWTKMAQVDVRVGANKGVKQTPSLQMNAAKVAVLVDSDGYALTAGSQRIMIPRQGSLYDQERLGHELRAIQSQSQRPLPVTVAIMDGIPFQHVVRVIDVAKAQDFTKVRLSDGNLQL